MKPDWLVPVWPAPARVQALCTTRGGGTSLPPYDSMNLGKHVGDAASAVAENRSILQQAISARPVFLSQVHGTQVKSIDGNSVDSAQADGSVTFESDVACTIMVADCLPVLLTNAEGTLVAAAHAGWRGLAGQGGQGILESTLAAFGGREVLAWLGPCIGPQAFEVGADVRDVFVTHDRAAVAMFVKKTKDKWLADLQGLARLRLAALGVTQIYGNDGSRAWCTFSNPARYFSHRRDQVSGRMAACIWLDNRHHGKAQQ
jgi:YfiH family protein